MAAGVAVTAFNAAGMLVPDHRRKLFTHSSSVIELCQSRQQSGLGVLISGVQGHSDPLNRRFNLPSCNSLRILEQKRRTLLDNVAHIFSVCPGVGSVR